MSESDAKQGMSEKVMRSILDLVSYVPDSKVDEVVTPEAEGERIAKKYANQAMAWAGAMALPPGPLGWALILPELMKIWRIQRQMVADLAALYGKSGDLNRNSMLYCLFRHGAAQAMRDVAVQVGGRVLMKRATQRVIQNVAEAVGVRVTQKVIGRGLSRMLPLVGAGAVALYARRDTLAVAETTIEFLESELLLDAGSPELEGDELA